jgi:aryl-alcohol dehydrogenase
MQVSAAVTRENGGPFILENLRIDEPRRDEVLVRIVGVGLCHSDVIARDGAFGLKLPAVFGHEGAGIVEQVGPDVTKVKPGQKVALTFLSCGHCPTCDAHEPAYCHSRRQINYAGNRPDGTYTLVSETGPISGDFFGQSSFASYALAHARNTVPVHGDIPLEIAGALGCGVQTGAGAVMRSMACKAGSSLVVLGGGSVGLSAVMGAVLQRCATIVVVEPHKARRDLALELGATHVVDPRDADIPAKLLVALSGIGADYVLDTTGVPDVIAAVCDFLAPRGTFGFVGVPPMNNRELKLPGTLGRAMSNGYTFRGIVEGDSDPDTFIPELLDHYYAGRFPFDKMVMRYPLHDINRAVQEQRDGKCIKAILMP